MTFTLLIDYIGTFAFAISGIRRASAKRFDLFGAVVVGFATGCGGGTLRDIMLGQTPFWMQSKTPFWEGGYTYLLVVLLALFVVYALGRYLLKVSETIFIFDTIGLGLFTVVGIEKSLEFGFPLWVAILMGMVTGAGGGVFRDIFINVEPLIFRKDIYALACVAGGLLFSLCRVLELPSIETQIVTASAVIAVRCLSMKYHWTLPVLSRKFAEYDEADRLSGGSSGRTAFNLEVIATSLEDVSIANASEASAIELCAGMDHDGLTPEHWLIRRASEQSRIPVRVMIRPTDRDFYYTDEEFEQMLKDIEFVRTTMAEGIVIGIITEDGEINIERMRKVVEAAGPLKITFHRAFEKLKDRQKGYADLAALGIDSILTTLIPELNELPRNPIRIRLGGGITKNHLPELRSRGFMNIHMGRAIREEANYLSPIDTAKIKEFIYV